MTSVAGLQVVVTCTNRKTAPVPVDMRIRSLGDGPPAARVMTWLDRLTSPQGPATAAAALYAGEHWKVVRELCQHLSVRATDSAMWVLSAGYGLVSIDAPLCSYAATFTPGQPDSVSADLRGRRQWWSALATWQGPTPGAPRTVEAIAREHPDDSLIVAASPAYLSACHDDLLSAATRLVSPDRLIVIATGYRQNGPLTKYILPADARLQGILGGTRQALNVRLLHHLVSTHAGPYTLETLTATTTKLMSSAPPIVSYQRTPMTDDGVANFIRRRLKDDPAVSRSQLLRKFRDAGLACEQSRFGRIFRDVQEDHSATS